MASVQLGNFSILLDDDDLPLLLEGRWSVTRNNGHPYVRRKSPGDGPLKVELLHRILMGCPDNLVVDHINGDGLDNRRSNLRICTHAENMMNRKIHRNNRSGFKGVYLDPQSIGNRWRAQIRVAGKKISLGRFRTAREAHEAYVASAAIFHGEFARSAQRSHHLLFERSL